MYNKIPYQTIWIAPWENVWYARSTKTQIQLRIHAVWPKSSLTEWRNFASLASEMRPLKILIGLRDCAGWSEFSPGAQVQS